MNLGELRQLVARVHDGRMARRAFIQRMIGLGLSAPAASMMLTAGAMRPQAAGLSAAQIDAVANYLKQNKQ